MTAQFSELPRIEGKTHALCTEPLTTRRVINKHPCPESLTRNFDKARFARVIELEAQKAKK